MPYQVTTALWQGDTARTKQDCETKAFHRLAERIKTACPRLPIMLLLDELYPTGPVMAHCHQYHWQFMPQLLAATRLGWTQF